MADLVTIDLLPGWNLISIPFELANPGINAVINANHPADIVMSYDNEKQEWMASRRHVESGLFTGDVTVMTSSGAYFIRSGTSQGLTNLQPPVAIGEMPPSLPPIIYVGEGWNLVPIVVNRIPPSNTIPSLEYFGTLGPTGWLKALTFDTATQAWESVSPNAGEDVKLGKGYWLYATRSGVIIP